MGQAGERSGGGAGSRARLAGAARRLLADQEGALLVFGLFVLLVMLAAAGLGIDIMRHERERARLQSTLDRAVLAAADLDHALDPELVVRSYFEAAGLSESLGAVTVERGLNHRSVSAQASHVMPTALLGLAGVEALRVSAGARAQESKTDVEISLVLDISGSMSRHNRDRNMRIAASQFVDTLIPADATGADAGRISITLVPYAKTVIVGPEILALYGIERTHAFSNCVLFEDAAFASAALTPGPAQRHHPHFRDGNASYLPGLPRRLRAPLCPRAAPEGQLESNALLALETDPAVLRRTIADLQLYDGTGIDIGMRWGIAMLDPSARPVIEGLATAGRVAPGVVGRPRDYGEEGVLKVAVLMTDGEPNVQMDLRPPLRSGPSNVWYDRVTGAYSVLLRGSHLLRYPYGEANPSDFAALGPPDGIARVAAGTTDDRQAPLWRWLDGRGAPIGNEPQPHPHTRHKDSSEDQNDWARLVEEGDLQRLSWPEVFDRFSETDSVRQLHRWPRDQGLLSNAEWAILGSPRQNTNTVPQQVARLDRLCSAAKARGILIFTIGFELDQITNTNDRNRARKLMRDCASSPAHYFDVESVAISEAFATIATQVQQLRLTR